MAPKDIWFSKGEYPIRQVIFHNMDSVLGGLCTSTMFKTKYGKINIMHEITREKNFVDGQVAWQKLMTTELPVVTTCWTWGRNGFDEKLVERYIKERGWEKDSVRVYCLGGQIYPRNYAGFRLLDNYDKKGNFPSDFKNL